MGFKIENKSVFFVAISQFGVAFSFSCVLPFMPFYITQISKFGPKETMIWIGIILGSGHVMAGLTSSFWGSLTAKISPKLLFERGMLCNGILFLIMGFTENLYILLFLRIIQGSLGGVSTIGLVIISSISQKERIHKDLSLYQNSMTAGQLIGPPVGAYVASLFGYRAAFILIFIVVSIFLVFCHIYVKDIPRRERDVHKDGGYKKILLFAWVLSLMITIHLAFLPSILPKILEGFGLRGGIALNSAGLIIMSYTVTALFGNYILSQIASKVGVRRVITIACILASLAQVLLILSRGVFSLMIIRMIQTGLIAPLFPLTISLFAKDIGGGMIGFLNSARFVGMAIGPLMATSILAYSNLLTLYLMIAGLTIISLWLFMKSALLKGL